MAPKRFILVNVKSGSFFELVRQCSHDLKILIRQDDLSNRIFFWTWLSISQRTQEDEGKVDSPHAYFLTETVKNPPVNVRGR